jgi:ribosome-associated protein
MDYGSVIVHIFSPADRDFYQLDKIWADAKKLSYTFKE